jgi:hypothetical protein
VLKICAHLSKIIVIKHHQFILDTNFGITAIIVKPTTLALGDLSSNEATFH